jgi:hypothetical protein
MANILEVVIKVTDQFTVEFGRAMAAGNSLEKSLGANFNKIGVLVAAQTAAISLLARQATSTAAQWGESLAVMSEKTGISTQMLAGMSFKAKLLGLDLESLQMGFKTLAGLAYDASRGSSEATAKFNHLGVAVRDDSGHLKTMDVLLNNVSDALSRITNPTERAAIAVDFFGRTGLNALPIFGQGSGALREWRERVNELGLSLSGPGAEALHQYQDDVETLHLALTGLQITMTTIILPTLEKVTNKVTEATVGMRQFGAEYPGITTEVWRLAGAIVGTGGLLAGIMGYIKWSPLAGQAMVVLATPLGALGALVLVVALHWKQLDYNFYSAVSGIVWGAGELVKGFGFLFPSLSALGQGMVNAGKETGAFADGFLVDAEKIKEAADKTKEAVGEVEPDIPPGFKELTDSIINKMLDDAFANESFIGEVDKRILDMHQLLAKEISEQLEKQQLVPEYPDMKPPKDIYPLTPGEFVIDETPKVNKTRAALEKMGLTANHIATGIGSAFGRAFAQMTFSGGNFARQFGQMMKQLFQDLMSEVLALIAKWAILNAIKGGGVSFLSVLGLSRGGEVPGFHQFGGEVHGPAGVDRVAARLTAGEWVIPKGVVDYIKRTAGQGDSGGARITNINQTFQAFDPYTFREWFRFGDAARQLRMMGILQ